MSRQPSQVVREIIKQQITMEYSSLTHQTNRIFLRSHNDKFEQVKTISYLEKLISWYLKEPKSLVMYNKTDVLKYTGQSIGTFNTTVVYLVYSNVHKIL